MPAIKSDHKLKKHLTNLIKKENVALKLANKNRRSILQIKNDPANKSIATIKSKASQFKPPLASNIQSEKLILSKTKTSKNKIAAPTGRQLNLAKIISRTIAPGLKTWIDANGHHFGDQPGSVQISISNKTFPVEILSWSHNWISVHFPNNIEGVYQTNYARIKITPKTGRSTTITKPFRPYIVSQDVRESILTLMSMNIFDMFSFETISFSRKIFNGVSLEKQWKIHSNIILPTSRGSCNKGSPYMANGGQSLESSVKVTYQRNSWVNCSINVIVRGPKGTKSGAE